MSNSRATNTVPCSCRNAVSGGDGLEHFEINPRRRIQALSQMVERGWYFLQVDLVGPITHGIEPRVGHALIPLSGKKEIYMVGGGNHLGNLLEVWRIDYSSPSQKWDCECDAALSLEFTGRYEFFCGRNKSQDKIWIFGGADLRNTKNDVCYIDVELGSIGRVTPTVPVAARGTAAPNAVPSPRTQGNNSCVVDLNGEEHLIVFGGGVGQDKAVADGHLYKFSIPNSTWSRIGVKGSVPTPVQGHAMLAIGSKVYVFGGMETSQLLYDDFFVIDVGLPEPKWNKIHTTGPKPPPRAAHGMTAIRNEIFLFGGVGENGSLCDLWKYHTGANEWTLIDSGMSNESGLASIPPRLDFAMTSLSVKLPVLGDGTQERDILVIHGGMNIMGHVFDDYWLFPLYFTY